MSTRISIGEVVDIFDKKRVPLNSRQRAERQGPFPYYGAQGIIDYIDDYIFDGRYLLVPEDGENLNSRKLPIAFFATGRFWVNNHAHILRGKAGRLDTDYLSYWLNDADIAGFVTGAAQPKLSQANLCRIEIDLPNIESQIAIGSFLRNYDDLIENNTRRIAILEEMARRIFEEWFVHFRAPGCEGLPTVESAIGQVPQGWEEKQIGDVFEVTGGGTPSKAEPTFWENGTINWFTPSDLTGSGRHFLDVSGLRITGLGLQKSSARMFPPYCVMMTSRATLGVFAINTTPATTNQGFITCLPNADVPLYFLYFWLRENEAEFERHASGATFKEITKGTFKKLPMLFPPVPLRRSFHKTVGPMMDFVPNLERQNRNLRAQRDLLLPKLISGEIDVSAAPALLAEAAE